MLKNNVRHYNLLNWKGVPGLAYALRYYLTGTKVKAFIFLPRRKGNNEKIRSNIFNDGSDGGNRSADDEQRKCSNNEILKTEHL